MSDEKRPTHEGVIGDKWFDGEQTWTCLGGAEWMVIDPPNPPEIVYR